jgi:hypothetical protein
MKSVVGNHVGIVVNTNDPENRGRVQVYIPHISTTLYNNWNEKLEDIEFKTFEENIFDAEIKERLLSLLPWAEAAVPMWGGGTGAPVNTKTGQPTPFPTDQSFSSENSEMKQVEGTVFESDILEFRKFRNEKFGASTDRFATKTPELYQIRELGVPGDNTAKISYLADDTAYEREAHSGAGHRENRAFDIPVPRSSTQGDAVANFWKQKGYTVIWRDGGLHEGHVHVEIPKNRVSEKMAKSSSSKSGDFAGKVSPIEMVAKDGLSSADGKFDSKLTNKNATISEVKKGMGLQTQAQADNAAVAYKTAYDESIRLGASPTQANTVASAIVGNISQESYFNNNTVHDGGIGYGLLGENQDIRTRMEQYAASKGESASNGGISTKTQIEALFKEPYFAGDKQRSGGFNNLKNMSNVPDASVLFAKGYLIPTAATANYENRANQAVAAANTFSNVDLNTISGSGTNTLNKIFRTTNQGIMATGSYNAGRIGGPAGMFSSPSVGAKVWVFFQAENPQRPVYFANVYEPSNAYAAGMPS